MKTMTIELTFSPEQLTQLDEVARARQLVLAETVQLAVFEWLERQQRLAVARHKMRQFGHGLGAGLPPHNVAKEHDARLYQRINL